MYCCPDLSLVQPTLAADLTLLYSRHVVKRWDKKTRGQSHLAPSGITVNMLMKGKGSLMGSSIVPLDRALMSSYVLSVITIPRPQFSPFSGRPGLLSNIVLLGSWDHGSRLVFLPARRYASAVFATATCPSVCLDVCLSHPVLCENGAF